MEISYDSAPTEVLALTEVAIPKVCEPDFLEGLKVVPADREHLLVHDPVHHIGAGGVCQRPLIVIEGINLVLRRLHKLLSLIGQFLLDSSDLGERQGVEHVGKADLLDQPEIQGAQLLYEGVAVVGDLE